MSENFDNDTEPHEQRLERIGLTEETFEALDYIWGDAVAFRLIADPRAGALASWGYTALDSLDAIWHELEENPAHLYMRHGFTPHQAHLLDCSPQAQANLWGHDRDTEQVHRLLDTDLPSGLLTGILLTALSHDAATAAVERCAQEVRGLLADGEHPLGGPEVTKQRRNAAALPALDQCECDPF